MVLAEVEVADDGGHAELVGAVEDAFEAGHEIGEEGAIGGDAGGLPGLGFGVTFGAAALEVEGEGEEAFDFKTFVGTAFVSGLTVDEELVAANLDFCFRRSGREQGWGGGEGEE